MTVQRTDVRPPGINVRFRPGNPVTTTLNFPAGYLAQHTLTATLDGDPLSVTENGNTLTVVADEVATANITGTVDWILQADGDDIIVGRWSASNRASTLPQEDVITVVNGSLSVDVSVSAVNATEGSVTSVNSRTGAVVLTYVDVGADPVNAADNAVNTHNLDTTSVHGITDTSTLLTTGTPTATLSGELAAHVATYQTALALTPGTNVQAYDADLATIAGLTATTDNFMVATSSAWASRTPSQARTQLGLGAAALLNATQIIRFVVDGGGSTILTGAKKAYVTVPWNCTITSWNILADISGSIVFDIWKDTYANYPPTVADTITASAKPTVTTATKATGSTLTGWTTSVTAGDVLEINVDSVTSMTKVVLELLVTRTT